MAGMHEPRSPNKCLTDAQPAEETRWRPENRFVPVRAADLERALVDDAGRFGCAREELRGALNAVRDVLEQETAALQRLLEEEYARFNPDCETRSDPNSQTEEEAYAVLHRQLAYLLDKANYERLTDEQIEEVMNRANSGRIRVRIHPERVERLELWVRGHGDTTSHRRTWRRPIKGEEQSTPVFKRMAVIAQLKGDPNVLIKLFKDIPDAEVEALMPHAEVAMTLLDRIKVFGGGAGALGAMTMKLAKVAIAFAMISKIMWILLIGLGTLTVRTFFGYRNAKTTRAWKRTQRLYFQNMGNNASALGLLISAVKQEELKEAYLAYAFALAHGDGAPRARDVEHAVEAYVREKWGARVDFDISDAIETIVRLGLVPPSGALRACPPRDASDNLRRHWLERRSADYHLENSKRMRAEAPASVVG